MSQELVYTSSQRGLRPGSRGYCTVACTQGMAKNLAELLESLSGYKHLFKAGGPQAHLNPVNHSYLRIRIGGVDHFVLSRIADCGLDFTQRSNKIAHHVVLDASELTSVGPAAISGQADFFLQRWEGEPRTMPFGRKPIPSEVIPSRCAAWEAAMGDPGWGGVLAQHAIEHPADPAFVIFPAGTDILPLFAESQQLLPPAARWSCSFSTYFATTPPGVDCRWRGVVDATPEAERLRRTRDRLVIDLVRRGPVPESSPYVEAARTGNLSRITTPTKQIPVEEKPTSSPEPNLRSPVATDASTAEAFKLPHSVPVGWEAGSAPPALPPRTPPQGEPRHVEDELWEPRRRAKGPLPLPLLIVAGSILLLLGVAVGAVIVSLPHKVATEDIQTNDRNTAVPKNGSAFSKPAEQSGGTANGEEADPSAVKEDEPSKPLKVEHDSESKEAAASTQLLTAVSAPNQRPSQQIKPTQASERAASPEGLFDGLRKEVSLPIFSSKVGDTGYLASVELGTYEGEWKVRPTLLLSPLSNVDLRIDPVANSKRWRITAGREFAPIAEVDLSDGKARIAWIKGPRKPNLKEEAALRTAFLKLDLDSGEQRYAVALQHPFPDGPPMKFSGDLAAAHFFPASEPNTPMIQIPELQQMVFTGKVTGLPMLSSPSVFRIVAGGSWEIPLDSERSVFLVIRSEAPKSDFHNPAIDFRLQISGLKNQKKRDFDREFLDGRLEARYKAVDSAIRRLETYHCDAMSIQLGNRENKLQFLADLHRAAGKLAQGDSLADRERYEKWLRSGAWNIPFRVAPQTPPILYINDNRAPALNLLKKDQQDYPLARLEAWKAVADAAPSAEIHVRATRQLRSDDAPGFKIPPYADVFVLGSPPPFDPDPSERN